MSSASIATTTTRQSSRVRKRPREHLAETDSASSSPLHSPLSRPAKRLKKVTLQQQHPMILKCPVEQSQKHSQKQVAHDSGPIVIDTDTEHQRLEVVDSKAPKRVRVLSSCFPSSRWSCCAQKNMSHGGHCKLKLISHEQRHLRELCARISVQGSAAPARTRMTIRAIL